MDAVATSSKSPVGVSFDGPVSAKEKVVFVVLRGSAAAQRPQAVFYGSWSAVRHVVCTAAGNIDSGSVFHGFRTVSEAAVYWRAAVGERPWPLGRPDFEAELPMRP